MSTICPKCQGAKVVENPNPSWTYDQMTRCPQCSGSGSYVSRARAGLADPIRTPVELWSTEALRDVVFRDSNPGKRAFADRFFPDHVRFEDLPPRKPRGDILIISTGPDDLSSKIVDRRIKWTSFDCVDEPVLTDADLDRMNARVSVRMADVGAAMHRKAEMLMRAALTGEPVKPHPDDVIGKIGDVEFTHGEYEAMQKILAEHGVTISVHQNRINLDFESYTGMVPGFDSLLGRDLSDPEKRLVQYKVESLPSDDKLNPDPRYRGGYRGDWKQGQRRGRR